MTHDRGLLLPSSVCAVAETEGKANDRGSSWKVNCIGDVQDSSPRLRFVVLVVCGDAVAIVHCLGVEEPQMIDV